MLHRFVRSDPGRQTEATSTAGQRPNGLGLTESLDIDCRLSPTARRYSTTAVTVGRDIPLSPPEGPGPFSLSDPTRVREVLTAAGFDEPRFADVHRPMTYGRDVATLAAMALGMVSGALVDLDDTARTDALAALRATSASHLDHDGVLYRSAMWIITALRCRSLAPSP